MNQATNNKRQLDREQAKRSAIRPQTKASTPTKVTKQAPDSFSGPEKPLDSNTFLDKLNAKYQQNREKLNTKAQDESSKSKQSASLDPNIKEEAPVKEQAASFFQYAKKQKKSQTKENTEQSAQEAKVADAIVKVNKAKLPFDVGVLSQVANFHGKKFSKVSLFSPKVKGKRGRGRNGRSTVAQTRIDNMNRRRADAGNVLTPGGLISGRDVQVAQRKDSHIASLMQPGFGETSFNEARGLITSAKDDHEFLLMQASRGITAASRHDAISALRARHKKARLPELKAPPARVLNQTPKYATANNIVEMNRKTTEFVSNIDVPAARAPWDAAIKTAA
jgi:hypothetical protein